jgi:hemerythrin superfamily protein
MGVRIEDARELATTLADELRRRGRDAYGQVTDFVEDDRRGAWPGIIAAGALGFLAGLAASPVRKAATGAVGAIAGDWLATIKTEHKQIEKLFSLIAATKGHESAKRHALLDRLIHVMERYSLQEEGVIYPELRDLDQGASSKALAADHFEMKTYLHELDRMEKDDPRWHGKVSAFRKLVKEHIRQEEEQVFPALKAHLSKAENARLTRDMLRKAARLD